MIFFDIFLLILRFIVFKVSVNSFVKIIFMCCKVEIN